MNMPFVSIIVPLHNEQMRLRASVEKIIRYGERNLMGRYEILLVENGSTDQTFELARELQRTFRPVKALQIWHRSKAHAVRYGMMMAEGEYRYMCDVDLSTPINELNNFLKWMNFGWDIVIASREHFDAKVETSFKRWFIGRVYSMLVNAFTGMDYKDTQCGFKLFSARAAEDIFSRTECVSLAFDVEALYLARQLGYYCTDMPVPWVNDRDSRVNILRDSWLMFKDVSRIKKLHRYVGRQHSPAPLVR
jgi:glycosyltransferase involved in cell wall biosynthesis